MNCSLAVKLATQDFQHLIAINYSSIIESIVYYYILNKNWDCFKENLQKVIDKLSTTKLNYECHQKNVYG